jgi:hypothetical protein
MKESPDNRRFRRQEKPGKVHLNWLDGEGHSFQATAQVLDVSKTGMRVDLEKPIAAGTMVNLESVDFHVAGVAMVKHCRAKGLNWVAGLQFAGGLEWSRTSES